MKPPTLAALIVLALTSALVAEEKEKHDHGTRIQAGPTGGRLITKVEPHAEFFVNKVNRIEIRFIDDDNKILAPAGQTITVIMGDRSKPTKLAFSNDGDKLVSDQVIPSGNLLPTVVQIKTSADAKTIMDRFNLNLDQCQKCKNREYACTCDHDHE